MSRRHSSYSRDIAPDPIYGSEMLQRFINRLMLDGKKMKAERITYEALKIASEKTGEEPLDTFNKVIENVSPDVEVRPRRVGGQTYQVPMDVRPERRRTMAIRWLVTNSRKRPGKSMVEKLAGEFVDAFNNTGGTVKKKEDTHKMAEANRAFSHYRF